MGFRTRLSALLAVLLLGFTFLGGTGVGAQDEEADDLQLEDLPGIQHGVGRIYVIDYSAMMENMGTPGAEMEMPSGLIALNGVVIEFDNDDNASSAFDSVVEDAGGEEMLDQEDVEEFDIELGDKSRSYFGVEDMEGVATESAVTIIQQDQYIYLVFVNGSDVDVKDAAKTLATTLVENDGSGEGEFNEDGTSTGGLWDKFPSSDDELVSGLIVSDYLMYPVPEDEDDQG